MAGSVRPALPSLGGELEAIEGLRRVAVIKELRGAGACSAGVGCRRAFLWRCLTGSSTVPGW